MPLAQTLRADVATALTADTGGRGSSSRAQRKTLNALVIGEVALACILLIGGALLFRAYDRLQNIDPGFKAENVLAFRLYLPEAAYGSMQAERVFYEELVRRVRGLPGVEAAAAISCPPLGCHWGNFYDVEGARPRAKGEPNPVVLSRIATPDYASTMGIKLVHGRFFKEGEGRDPKGGVIVINEEFAREFYAPGVDPLGHRIRFDNDQPWLTVVGVVRDARHYGLEQPMRPGMYVPLAQLARASLSIVLRTHGDPTLLAGPVRRTLRQMNPELPLSDVTTMQEALDKSFAARRMYSWMLGVFAAVALVLAIGGIYGVLSYVVGQRTRELGIRMALGARKAQMLRLVVGDGLRLAGAGILIGLLGAFATMRVLSTMLLGISPHDPLTYTLVAAVLALTALIAALLPARRAISIEPQQVLRH
jgi:predicted permease